uniref:ATP-grasp domain-containing protein n=1 Tax=Macrostomum lignano TaxID=282301 RepID=A0A1I8IX04_9PLAT
MAIDADSERPRRCTFAFCSASLLSDRRPNSFEAFRCRKVGLPVPRTLIGTVSVRTSSLVSAQLPAPFILKPDRGGSGSGVRLFDTVDEFESGRTTYFAENPCPTGLYLFQEYLDRSCGFYRAEFVGKEQYLLQRRGREALRMPSGFESVATYLLQLLGCRPES